MSAVDRYAVLGHPAAHSLSPAIHRQFAGQFGHRISYEAIDVPPATFDEYVRRFFAEGGCGLNITVPHKLAACGLADRLTPRARAAGAVNTLKPEADGQLLGDNTDGAGLVRDLTANLGLQLESARILMLGAGGAARGVLLPLLAQRPCALAIVNRTPQRAVELAATCGDARVRALDGSAIGTAFDLVINATSAHLAGEQLVVPPAAIGARTACYDMGYRRGDTPFMAWARVQGASIVESGIGMLVEQAAESYFVWRGVRPETAPVIAGLRSRLAQ